jgi:hypothetical protein
MHQSGIFEQINRPVERLFSSPPPGPAQAHRGTLLQPTDEYSDHCPFPPMRPPTRCQIYGPKNHKGGVIRLTAKFLHTIKAKRRIITVRSPITALGNLIFARPTHTHTHTHTLCYDAGIMNSGELDINNLRQHEEYTRSDNLSQRLTLRNSSLHGAREVETEYDNRCEGKDHPTVQMAVPW